MRAIHILLIFAVLLALSIDSAQGWGRWGRGRRWRWLRRGLGCKLVYGVGCTSITSGLASTACAVKAATCKRTLGDEGPQKEGTFSVPLDNVFADYDDNNDDYIDLEEFYFTMTSDIPLENPDRLKEMFNAADRDDDGLLDHDEFENAPFDFRGDGSLNKFDDAPLELEDD